MNTDKPLGAVLVLLGGGGIALASQITVRTFNNDPGPKLFPIFACAILVICGLGMLFTKGNGERAPALDADMIRRAGAAFGLMVVYALGLWLVGFTIATILGMYAFYHVMAGPEKRVIWRGLLFAVLLTCSVKFTAGTLLSAYLPQGILF